MKNEANITGAMFVGEEDGSDIRSNQSHKNQQIEAATKRFGSWIFGIVISFIPLLAVPMFHLLYYEDFNGLFFEIISDIGIIFISISFSITALNDFWGKSIKEEKEKWTGTILILLLLGALIYGVFAIFKDLYVNSESSIIFWFNLIYFISMFIIAGYKYLSEIITIKKGE